MLLIIIFLFFFPAVKEDGTCHPLEVLRQMHIMMMNSNVVHYHSSFEEKKQRWVSVLFMIILLYVFFLQLWRRTTSYARCPFQVRRLAQVTTTSSAPACHHFSFFLNERMRRSNHVARHHLFLFFCFLQLWSRTTSTTCHPLQVPR